MRAVFINPPLTIQMKSRRINPVIKNLFFNSPPLGLGYLAAACGKPGDEVSIIDASAEELTCDEIAARVRERSADIVGITSTTTAFPNARQVAAVIKGKMPGLPVILGGPHVSADPESAMAFREFDAGVLGEAEVTFPELAQALSSGRDLSDVPGIAVRRDGKTLRTGARPLIEDMDTIPFPRRDLFPLRLYRPQPNDEYRLPKMSMITSRGCPWGCIFCDKNVFGRKYRSFSPGYIVREMEHLVKEFGARDIAFVDSLFALNAERISSILEEIEKRGVRVSWTCTVRANIITKELLRRMRGAGCWRIRLGIESGDPATLEFIKKSVTVGQIRDAARWADEEGLQPKGFFMIGHLTDTRESIEKSISLAMSLPLKDITVQMNTPLAGTEQFGLYARYGSMATSDISDFTFWQPTFVPGGMTEKELVRLYSRFYRKFYLRPVIVWRHLSRIRSLRDVLRYVRVIRLVLHLFFRRDGG